MFIEGLLVCLVLLGAYLVVVSKFDSPVPWYINIPISAAIGYFSWDIANYLFG
jgi:hypothetical protein